MDSKQLQSVLTSCRARRQSVIVIDSEVLQTNAPGRNSNALKLDLSSMASVYVDIDQKLAIVGPGANFSTVWNSAKENGMAPEFEPLLGLDFTMGDWAHESLRMLSTGYSGLDGVLRNVKAIAPTRSFQTGFDRFPANGGGYDLTKLFMSSGGALGVPYEFAVPLRLLPEKVAEKRYAFGDIEKAIEAGVAINRSSLAALIHLESGGFMETLFEGKKKPSGSSEIHLIARSEGSQALIEASEKAMDEITEKFGGKAENAMKEIDGPSIAPLSSVNPNTYVLGAMACDTRAMASVIDGLSKIAGKAKSTMQYRAEDLSPNGCILVPILAGEKARETIAAMGEFLTDKRISLRGNREWNSVLGDSRAPIRIEIVGRMKRFLDPEMILNPHAMGVVTE